MRLPKSEKPPLSERLLIAHNPVKGIEERAVLPEKGSKASAQSYLKVKWCRDSMKMSPCELFENVPF